MPEFFVQLLKRVAEKENVFTECLAAALRHDPELARDFLGIRSLVIRFAADR